MRAVVILLLLLTFVVSSVSVAEVASDKPVRPVHTFSIVARDPATGELGVAVQSHWFSVGSIVAWAEAGVGAVATQSFVDPSYGKNGLELMRNGKSAPDTLKELLAKDEGREVRQVAMIDAQGRVDAWTGKNDIQAAGHIVGKDFSVQANLMLNEKFGPQWHALLRVRRVIWPSVCWLRSTRRRQQAATFAGDSQRRSLS